MRIGLVVDSGCDLPKSFIDEYGLLVLPVSIRLGDQVIVDDRDPQRTRQFYATEVAEKAHDAESVPFTMEQIKALFLERVVLDFDYALVQTVPKSRSPIFANATEASHAILREYKPIRKRAGVEGPFALRVTDSQTLFAGQGALAAETVRLIESGMKITEIRQSVEVLASQATGYAVVPDIYYLHKRAKKRGDKSVSWAGAILGNALDIKPVLCARQDETFPVAKMRGFDAGVEAIFRHAVRCIERGLTAPVICVSYAGDESRIRQMPGFDKLAAAARDHDVALLLSTMGLTGAVNIGPGALSLGMIVDDPTFLD
ncbi:MAG: DegV family protein [Alcanivorax sp.]|uniref:DegV family protein n=1 Tax=Alloalcanivorax marinus TaxID=1177169 RepID=UPI00195AF885|nr:DegV family protein [Alloalcanivorax marinus]MBM7334577.1 DegV family protein [Alloalcanivorax marinus]